MATTNKTFYTRNGKEKDIIGVDIDMSLYDLTDMFYNYYRYHNDESNIIDNNTNTNNVASNGVNKPNSFPKTMSRFAVFRKLEGLNLGSRPFGSNEKIAAQRPNVNLGYFRLLIDYVTLPLKSIFTDSDLARIQYNRKLYNIEHLSNKEKEALKLEEQNNPFISSNKEVSDDITDAFVNVLKASSKFNTCADFAPRRFTQDAFCAFLHSDLDWQPTPIHTLDLITEPFCEWNPKNWSSFFIIKKMSVSEVTEIIRTNKAFWNSDALKWALYCSSTDRGLLNGNHYSSDPTTKACGENFTVRSFTRDKANRTMGVTSYYGDMLVIEGYYINKKGKVNKVIFFPSTDFLDVSDDTRKDRMKNPDKYDEFLKDAGVLFHRRDVFDCMRDAITVIPANRDEPTLERQRWFGHEVANPCESIMRLDSSILNFSTLMGTPFTKNRAQGTDAQNLEDLEISFNGDMVDLGDRDFIETPFTADINGMLAVRNTLIQHAMSKAFLGGLDGQEMMSNGRGASLANLRLIRDARIHKHAVESFSKGLKELYTKMFLSMLNLSKKMLDNDVLVQKLFFDTLTKLHGYPKDLLEYDNDEVIEDTGLPYWIEIEAIRNGGSHFGAAELVLYSEIKQIFGDSLDQRAMNALNRNGIKSVLGSQDALDILGDPKDNLVTDKDQVYRATVETTAILGSVDSGALSFESIPILEDKDDHVTHLTQVHLPKAQEMLQAIQNVETSPESLAQMSDRQLETHNNLILKLGALGNHISEHAGQLERFGNKRPDINKLKEDTNSVLQSIEGLMNSLKITLRTQQQRDQEAQLKLQNISPENEAEKMKQQTEQMKLQVKQEEIRSKLMIANKIADQGYAKHRDDMQSKANDRQAKILIAERQSQDKKEEARMKALIDKKKKEEKSTSKSK